MYLPLSFSLSRTCPWLKRDAPLKATLPLLRHPVSSNAQYGVVLVGGSGVNKGPAVLSHSGTDLKGLLTSRAPWRIGQIQFLHQPVLCCSTDVDPKRLP